MKSFANHIAQPRSQGLFPGSGAAPPLSQGKDPGNEVAQSPLTWWGHLSKVRKDKPDSDDILNNGEYQETNHKQDPVAKFFPIEDSSEPAKRAGSDFERALNVICSDTVYHSLFFLRKRYNSLFRMS